MTENTPSVNPAPISRRLRFEILRRDGHTCRYCGATAPDVPMTVDHVVPRVLGGSDDPSNLVAACRDCNFGKGSTSPSEQVVADVDAASMLFARAMERAAAIRRTEIEVDYSLVTEFDAAWNAWHVTTASGKDYPVPRDAGWEESVIRFLSTGLNNADLARFIKVAMSGKVAPDESWKYFCGCCWREISNRQELARRLIEDGSV